MGGRQPSRAGPTLGPRLPGSHRPRRCKRPTASVPRNMSPTRTEGLVSVIMPVYRGAPYVAAAIESALAQTYRPVELVIVNDGSPDDSASEIARFLPHPRIRYLEQQNSGVANARNTGIDNSTGALIALL